VFIIFIVSCDKVQILILTRITVVQKVLYTCDFIFQNKINKFSCMTSGTTYLITVLYDQTDLVKKILSLTCNECRSPLQYLFFAFTESPVSEYVLP
jgi:hypothetical protein